MNIKNTLLGMACLPSVLAAAAGSFFKPIARAPRCIYHRQANAQEPLCALGVLLYSVEDTQQYSASLNQSIHTTWNDYQRIRNQPGFLSFADYSAYDQLLMRQQVQARFFPSQRKSQVDAMNARESAPELYFIEALEWLMRWKTPFCSQSYDVSALTGPTVEFCLGLPAGLDVKNEGMFHNIPVLRDEQGVFGTPSFFNRAPIGPDTKRVMTVLFSFNGHQHLDLVLQSMEKTLKPYASVQQRIVLQGLPSFFALDPTCNHDLSGFNSFSYS